MFYVQSHLATATAACLVIGLAVVGFFSHQTTANDTPLFDVINGSYQTRYEASFIANNPLDGFALATLGALRYAVFGQAQKGAVVGKNGWLFTTEELEQSPKFTDNINAAADQIAKVDAQLSARGITLIPVLVPDKAEIYADMLRVRRPENIVNRRALLLDALADRDIRAMDAAPSLRDAMETKDVFMQSDTHWSPHGSQAVATDVAELVSTTRLALTSATVTTQQENSVIFDGDLLRFVPTGALRALIGPEQEQIARFTTRVETSGGLFDEPTIDVALVGTSFSARSEWHFAGFLQQALGADVINFAQEGQGPFAPMSDFLRSDMFKNTPPKLVIWEIPVRYTSKEMNQ